MTSDRFTSVRRSDVSATIYRAIRGNVETLFGDSISAIHERGDHVQVDFEHAPSRAFDLVIGADGLHSRVRRLAFGPDNAYAHSLGYHVAAFEAVGYRPREDLVYVGYSLPGRQISRFSMRDDRTMFLFVFENKYIRDRSNPRSLLRDVFAGAEWEWPQIEAEIDRAPEIYLDSVSQIRMDRWTRGRVALVGDAAACVSLMAGEGTGLAIAEAYTLAGELHAADGDHTRAFARYQERMKPFLAAKQRGAANFASSFAPSTRVGIAVRNVVTRFMDVPIVANLAVGRALRDNITLPEYW